MARRSKPLRPGAPAARHWAPLMVGAGKPVKGEPTPSGPAAVGEKVCPPGAMRSKPINTARGTPWVWRTCGVPGLRF